MAFLKNRNSFLQKTLAGLLVIIITITINGAVLLLPKKSNALFGGPMPVVRTVGNALDNLWQGLREIGDKLNLGENTITAIETSWQSARTVAESIAGQLLVVFINQLLAQLTNKIVDWIHNEGEPRFMAEGASGFLGGVANQALGNFVNNYLGLGWLCEPFDLEIKIALQDPPDFETKTECSLEDIVDNVEEFYDDFSKGGWVGWIDLTTTGSNFWHALMLTKDKQDAQVAEAVMGASSDANLGDGFLSIKECEWRDAHGRHVETQEDVRGEPPMPEACSTGAVSRPCQVRCSTLTPSSVVSETANKSITNVMDKFNSYIAGAVAKAGPFAVYVQAIADALIGRVLNEGIGLVGSFYDRPSGPSDKDDLGITDDTYLEDVAQDAQIFSQILEDYRQADGLIGQVGLLEKDAKELHLQLEEALRVLEETKETYQSIIGLLNSVISECGVVVVPPASNHQLDQANEYIVWAEGQIDNINHNLLPPIIDKIDKITIAENKANTAASAIDPSITSINQFKQSAEAYITAFQQGVLQQPPPEVLNDYETMNSNIGKLIDSTYEALQQAKAAFDTIDLGNLTNLNILIPEDNVEAQSRKIQMINEAIVEIIKDLEEAISDPNFPAPGSLYAEKESAVEFTDALSLEATKKINSCRLWQPRCGNGFIDTGETCDDNNTNNNDGCNSNCQEEAGWDCDGEPSICQPTP